LFDETATPSQRSDVDIDSISETPSTDDYYLYSRIDGNQTVEQLCQTSGLGKQATLDGLERLLKLGLIEIPGADIEPEVDPADSDESESGVSEASVVSEVSETSSTPQQSQDSPILGARSSSSVSSTSESSVGGTSSGGETAADSASSGAESSAGSRGESSTASESSDSASGESAQVGIDLSHLPVPPGQYEYDEDLLEMDVPLSGELKRELLVLDEQVDELTHYQFFGVDRDAPQGAIKKSYFKLSKRYHPDKHFRKEIGPYEEKLENVFQKITRAYRTLSNPEQREEYDEELAEEETRETSPETDEETPTPMSNPSKVHMANESASSRAQDQSQTGTDKRKAAFAKLVKKAETFRKRSNFEQAAEMYRKALSLKRDLKVALQATRVLLNADAQLEQAELFARAALRIDEEHLEARMMLARTFERRDQITEAVDQYDRVLEIEPGYEKAETRRKRLVRN
jgi:curved DNA-binding protein CbpA